MAKLVSPIFTGSFLWLQNPQPPKNGTGEPKFGLTAIFEPAKFSEADKKRWDAMMAMANELSIEKFKKALNKLPSNFKQPMRDGEEKEELEGFGPGKKFCSLTSRMRPGIVGLDKEPITDLSEIFSGCKFRATVNCYSYDNEGKGIAFGLQNLQFIGKGKRLDSRTDAGEDFANEAADFEVPADGDGGDDDFLN
jgi:hypothetical protein